jgi:hypothetical protein
MLMKEFHAARCGRGPGVKDVLGRFLALVLHRIKQQAVQFLDDRQHRLARHRRPAAEDGVHFILGQQLAGFFREQRPVGRRIDDHRLEFFAGQAAFLFCSSISISMVSFSVVSLIAMVPDKECSTPTLMVSAAFAAPIIRAKAVSAPATPSLRSFKEYLFMVKILEG